MLLKFDDEPEITSPPPHSGKDEMNFAEFPMALLTDRAPKGQSSIRFEDQIYDERRKKVITRRRIIEGSEEYGLPTATDDTVILALIQLTKLKGNFKQREVDFTRLELIKLLGWTDEGRNYQRIKRSLQRIANVTYNYDNAWWDGRQKTWTTKIFHILDTVEINDSRTSGGQKGLFPSRVVWNEVVFDSFQAGFLRNIDFQLCMQLEHPIALRMYRFLGKRFHARPEWVFNLKEFAHKHVWLGANYEGGTQIARKLKPAIAELEKIGFLEPLSEKERFIKKGWDWSIRFVQKAPALPAIPSVSQETTATLPLVAELIHRGVTKMTAADLVQRFPAEAVEAKVEVFDWLRATADKRIAKNPAGYLVKSIEDDYSVPDGYLTKAERQRQQEAKASNEAKAIAEQRRKREELDQDVTDRQNVKAYLDRLSESGRAELEKTVLAAASADIRESYENVKLKPSFRETLMLGLLREHLAPQLRTKPPIAENL